MEFNYMFLLQTFGAFVVSMMIGFAWYSEAFFGPLWWKHNFPGILFGNCEAIKNRTDALTLPPFSTTVLTCACQCAILAFTINTILPMFAAHSPASAGLGFPLTFSAIVAATCACTSFPHYAYPRKPFVLYLIGTGHDTIQIFVSVFVIYFLCK